MAIQSINPATNEKLRSFEPLSADKVVEAITKSDEAFRKWRQTSFAERKWVMFMRMVRRRF